MLGCSAAISARFSRRSLGHPTSHGTMRSSQVRGGGIPYCVGTRTITQSKLAGVSERFSRVRLRDLLGVADLEMVRWRADVSRAYTFRDHIKPLGVPAWQGAMHRPRTTAVDAAVWGAGGNRRHGSEHHAAGAAGSLLPKGENYNFFWSSPPSEAIVRNPEFSAFRRKDQRASLQVVFARSSASAFAFQNPIDDRHVPRHHESEHRVVCF